MGDRCAKCGHPLAEHRQGHWVLVCWVSGCECGQG